MANALEEMIGITTTPPKLVAQPLAPPPSDNDNQPAIIAANMRRYFLNPWEMINDQII